MPATTEATAAQLNWTQIEARCIALGATTAEARADVLGADRTTVWRWKQGANITLARAQEIADRLNLNLGDILAEKPKPPTRPPKPPKPPAAPGDSRPPAGPKKGNQ